MVEKSNAKKLYVIVDIIVDIAKFSEFSFAGEDTFTSTIDGKIIVDMTMIK